MTRAFPVLTAALWAVFAISALAQEERTSYREAYRAWRQADPDLERDAASGGGQIGARADKAAAEAAHYFAARKTYLDTERTSAEQKAGAIEAQPAPPAAENAMAGYASLQGNLLAASIETISRDPDRGIQQLRQALELERGALTALSAALTDTQKGLEAVARSTVVAQDARGIVIEHYRNLTAGLQQSAQQTSEAGVLWTAYYRTLSEGARGAAREPVSIPSTALPRAPTAAGPDTTRPSVVSNAGNAAPSATGNAAPPTPRTPTITPLPLFRYVGGWTYPTVGAEYRGIPPESVDLQVRAEDGQAKGTLMVRFQLSPNGPTSPILRFDFEGPLAKTRNQSFPLVTSGGAKGTVELIPGAAINLLEVRFTTDAPTGTVRQGGFVLIKK